MNISRSIKTLWLAIVVLALAHSLFPPRIYEKSLKYAGRSLVLSTTFYRADFMVWDDAMTNTPQQAAFHSGTERSFAPERIASWNLVQFDFGSYFAEIAALIFIGAGFTLNHGRPAKINRGDANTSI